MDCRIRNMPISKRVFGKDITNIESRRAKNNSISQKPALISENRTKSKSFDKKIHYQARDPIVQYQAEILNFMISIQNKEKVELMNNVTADMRQILVDWLVDVHQSFELKQQTLYLALAYLNEFSSCYDITKHEYQLVGISCLWIASKYEEIYPPRMQNYINVTDSAYSANELKNMEGKILLALKFNLTFTTPLQILQTVSQKWSKQNGKLSKESIKTLCMCKYLIELSLFENLGKQYCMKTLVLSSLMLSDSVLKVKSESKVLDNSRVQKETLMRCFKDMCLVLQNVSRPNIKLRAIKKKFSEQRYMGISRFRIEHK